MDHAVLVQGLTKLFPEFGDLRSVDFPDGGFKRGHAEVHGRAWGQEVHS